MKKIGGPQARRRVIIIGLRKDINSDHSQKLEEELHSSLHSASKFRKYPLTSLEVFEGKELPLLQSRYEEIMRQYEGIWEENNTPEMLKWKTEVWDHLKFDVVKDYFFMNNIAPNCKDEIRDAFENHKELLKELGYYQKNVKNINPSDQSNKIPNETKAVKERS